ncbi:hypothetical protein NVP1244A_109 [Vibrio phage 1.244.A._10N.261.54.C3]|nr:hypothetical protein NVP1244A_109 [Vibrio phage 1.244.A._10N.261.54.C3]AUR98737.1 hypothetical protein NVP1255O_109 [Vibrio phage 1.255.O._10N.286.45.F1]
MIDFSNIIEGSVNQDHIRTVSSGVNVVGCIPWSELSAEEKRLRSADR